MQEASEEEAASGQDVGRMLYQAHFSGFAVKITVGYPTKGVAKSKLECSYLHSGDYSLQQGQTKEGHTLVKKTYLSFLGLNTTMNLYYHH